MKKMSLMNKLLLIAAISLISMISVCIKDITKTLTRDIGIDNGVTAGVEDVIDFNNYPDAVATIEDLSLDYVGIANPLSIGIYGFTSESIEVRTEPNYDSDVICVHPFNTCVYYRQFNDEWAGIRYYNGTDIIEAYIPLYSIMEEECSFTVYEISSPYYTGTKTWMSYTAISSKSKQGRLQLLADTDSLGFRKIKNRYLIAIGTRFNASIGQYVDLILEDGTIINCIMGDAKANIHTEDSNTFTTGNGSWCCSEFIMDPKVYGGPGNVSNYLEELKSPVSEIIVYDKFVTED